MVDREGVSKKKKKAPRRRGRKATKGGTGGGGGGSSVDDRASSSSSSGPPLSTSDAFSLPALVPPSYGPHKSLLIRLTESTPTWHEVGRNAPGRNDTIFAASSSSGRKAQTNPRGLADRYRSVADAIYEKELELFRAKGDGGGGRRSSSSDERWVEGTMRKGTLKDRVAAASVVASEEPVHKPHALDTLLDMAGCDERGGDGMPNARAAQMAAEALSDLFVETHLPEDRRLVGLDERPLHLYSPSSASGGRGADVPATRTLSPRLLLLWRYEELVKSKYSLFLSRYLSRTLNDGSSSDSHRTFALRTACRLLRDRPEGESALLSMAVNKLGDPNRRVAASAGHELRGVLTVHPNMVQVVAREVQQLAHRPRLSPRALYNCIIFLNQIQLSRNDDDDEKNDADEEENNEPDAGKGGHNKASDATSSLPASLIDTYFRLFEVAVQKTSPPPNGKTKVRDEREDVGMKGRLLSALLTGVNRARPYLPAKEEEHGNERMEKRVDALYRIVHAAPPRAKTQALTLLFQLAVGSPEEGRDDDADGRRRRRPTSHAKDEAKEARTARFYRALYATLNDPSTLESGKHLTLYFNLLYKSMKYDPDDLRVVAFGKRLLCRTIHSDPTVIGGALFLLSEVMKFREGGGLRAALEEEEEEETKEGSGAAAVVYDPTKREPRAAFVRQRIDDDEEKENPDQKIADGLTAKLWETTLLSRHYHPSAAKFSADLGRIDYLGDPLRDFALVPFLDKFAYRNPKGASRLSRRMRRGESVAERRHGIEGRASKATSLPLNDPSFADRTDVSEEDEFFHKFFVERRRRDELKGIVRGKGAAEEGSEEEGDEALDRAEKGADVDREFDDDDDGWETDPEEEAFVNDLAEKLMDGGGKANFDDEDPDMEGWSDDSDDDDEEQEKALDYSAMDGFELGMEGGKEAEEGGDGGGEGDADAFMDADGSSESDGDEAAGDGPTAAAAVDDFSSDDGLAAAFAKGSDDEENSDDSDGNDANSHGSSREKRREKKDESKKTTSGTSGLFADASEYEKLIEAGWSDRKKKKRSRESTEDGNEDDEEDAAAVRCSETDESHRSSRKKKKKKKRKTKQKRAGGN